MDYPSAVAARSSLGGCSVNGYAVHPLHDDASLIAMPANSCCSCNPHSWLGSFRTLPIHPFPKAGINEDVDAFQGVIA